MRYYLIFLLLFSFSLSAQIPHRTIILNDVSIDLTFDSSYIIPNQMILTTLGTSGAATWSGDTLNIPIYSGASDLDSFIWDTRLWRQKGVDSVSSLLSSYYPLSNPSSFISDINDVWGTIITSNNNIQIDSFLLTSRDRLYKIKDSIIDLIPSTTGFTTYSDVNDTANDVRNYALSALDDSSALKVKYLDSNTVFLTPHDTLNKWLPIGTNIPSGTVTSVGLVAGTGTSITGTSPITGSGVFTISATGGLTAGSGISLSGSFPVYTVTNSSPNQTVTLTSGTGATVSGSYPSYTISATGVPTVTPGGSVGQVQYDNSGAFGGAAKTSIQSDGFPVLTSVTTTVSVPSAGNVTVYSSNKTGIDEISVVPSIGVSSILQNSFSQKFVSRLYANGNSSLTGDGYFASATTTAGTFGAVNRSYDATNALPNFLYLKMTGATSTNSSAGWWINAASRSVLIGNSAFCHGSKLTMTFGFPVYTSTQRFFCGYQASSAGTPSSLNDPSAFINVVGVGKDAADGTLQVMYNDGSGTATKVNTSITPNANDVYRVTIYLPPNCTTAYVTVEDITKTSITTFNSNNSANLPSAGTLMYFMLYGNSAATSTAAVSAIIQVVEEQY